MSTLRLDSIYPGDVRETLRSLPDASINCCVTSPPYWGLRSYDEDAVMIDPSLSEEVKEWILGELAKRGIYAR